MNKLAVPSKSFNSSVFVSSQQKTTTRLSITTTTRRQLNMSREAKIAIMDVILRKIAAGTIRSARRIRRTITRQTTQVPRDQRAENFHRSARKIGIIPQGWTISRWLLEHSGRIIQVNCVSPHRYPHCILLSRNSLTQHQPAKYLFQPLTHKKRRKRNGKIIWIAIFW